MEEKIDYHMVGTIVFDPEQCYCWSGLLPEDKFIVFACLTVIGGLSGAFYNGPFTSILQTRIGHTALGRDRKINYSVLSGVFRENLITLKSSRQE